MATVAIVREFAKLIVVAAFPIWLEVGLGPSITESYAN